MRGVGELCAELRIKLNHPTKKMTFHFGKYRGRDIEEIRFRDPRYVIWCIENVEGFQLTAEKFAEKSGKPKRSRKRAKSHAEAPPNHPKPRPAYEWHDHRPNPVLEAILADPILAYCHPREMHMATDWTPNVFATGDEPPY